MYNYLEHLKADVLDAIKNEYSSDELRAILSDDRDNFAQDLNDSLWTDDNVTGNCSGSYYCNAYEAEEALCHNWDLLADAIEEFGGDVNILRQGPEACDVTIRCYLLPQAIDEVLEELEEELSDEN